MAALDLTYEDYIAINGGEHCGVCGCPPPPGRRLDRDHEHAGEGRPRGLLCRRDNRLLSRHLTADWLRDALAYLERTGGPDALHRP